MPNSFDLSPRSPSDRRIVVLGLCLVAAMVAIAALMVAKSKGTFDKLVRVDIALVNIGDGLPARSDVKFRGVLVGSVTDVTPAGRGHPNLVHVALKPQYAPGIPNTVTARVVPANLFAVSAIQLVDNGTTSGPLQAGAVVPEDTTLPTVLFQNVLAKLRQLLAAMGRKPDANTVGMLEALAAATHGRGRQLTDAGRQMNEILAELNTTVGTDETGPSTLAALSAATDSLRVSAPELFDVLDSSIRPLQTTSEKAAQLRDLLFGSIRTVGTLGDAFDHQTDRLITISTEFTPVLALIGEHAGEFHGISTRMQRFSNAFYDEAYDADKHTPLVKIVIGFTPSRTYVRADCPRYGALEGPSCKTAPEVPTAPDLLPALGSMGFEPTPGLSENRPNPAPPRGSVRGIPDGPLNMPQHDPATGDRGPAPVPEGERLTSTVAPEASGAGGAQEQPVVIGGNVGPVGSRQEKGQLGRIVGENPSVATELLLGPLARGMTVHIRPDRGGAR